MSEAGASLGPFDIAEVMRCLPHRFPMLLVDRVESLIPNESIIALKAVTMNEPFFAGHFPARPIMPGVLIVEALAQAAGVLGVKSLGEEGSGKLLIFLGIEHARFRKPVEPGCLLHLHVRMTGRRKSIYMFKGEARIGDMVAAEADFTAMVTDPPA